MSEEIIPLDVSDRDSTITSFSFWMAGANRESTRRSKGK
jgi:hypothetical protein